MKAGIINLTILECKHRTEAHEKALFDYNKSNHIGM